MNMYLYENNYENNYKNSPIATPLCKITNKSYHEP